MIITARQLEDLHRTAGSNGRVTLPYRARLSPLAQDWIRRRKVQVGYADVEAKSDPKSIDQNTPAPTACGAKILWWCDGPCGPAKAALMAQARESSLAELPVANDPNLAINAIKSVAIELKTTRASGAILLVQHAAAATVYANRCPSIRAILGTCIESVEQGLRHVAANVLVIEHPHKTLPQVKNLIARFARGVHAPDDAIQRQLEELSRCA